MSRMPKPTSPENSVHKAWKPTILPADYSDDVTDADLEALRNIVAKEFDEKEYELVDGPAW